jgi:hypothetical protein
MCYGWYRDELRGAVVCTNEVLADVIGMGVVAGAIAGAYGYGCGWLVGRIAGRVTRWRVGVLTVIALVFDLPTVFALYHDDPGWPPWRGSMSWSAAVAGLPVLLGVLRLERLTRREPPIPRATVR